MEQKFLNLHEILQDTADDESIDEESVPFTYRVPKSLKTKVDQICRGNGVKHTSRLVRRVFYQLVKEYVS